MTKKLTIDFIECVPWKQIEQAWGKREYKRFVKWMRGQTVATGGVYSGDIESYARERNKGIKEPRVYD